MTPTQHSLAYRPEIDGMRAIAVVSVMIYHLKIPTGTGTVLPGGFFGVDLFFVLSGFLITQILVREFDRTGMISIRQFYWRRAKRILPPLLLVMLASLPFAWIVLLPSELERFSLSALSALGFVSNIFWFFELSEYGAQSGLLQPFLHTWSLAIEEQFYIVFPPLLILLLRYSSAGVAIWVIVAVLLLSLVAAEVLTRVHAPLSFYSPTSRAWEMLAGSLLAMFKLYRPDLRGPRALQRVVPVLSLFVFLAAVASWNLADIIHPGFVTIPVVLATCGLIWFTAPGDLVTRILSAAPLVFVGKLSYSLYLWHFPIFAFGRLSTLGTPTTFDMLTWLVLTFMLSVLGYHLVEKPFRFSVQPRQFVVALIVVLVPVVGGALLVATGHMEQRGRVAALKELYGINEIDNTVLARESWSILDDLAEDEEIGSWNALRPSQHGLSDLWFNQPNSRKVLLIGDSHSKDVFNALTLNKDLFPNLEFARFNLHRKSLAGDLVLLKNTPNFAAADVIVIAPRYYREYRSALETMLAALKGSGKDVLILGPSVEFDVGGAQPLFDWYLQKSGAQSALADLNALAPKYERLTSKSLGSKIRAIAEDNGVPYLSRRDLMCNGIPEECTLVTPDGLKTMYDDSHWSLAGAKLFGARAAQVGWFSDLAPQYHSSD